MFALGTLPGSEGLLKLVLPVLIKRFTCKKIELRKIELRKAHEELDLPGSQLVHTRNVSPHYITVKCLCTVVGPVQG